MRDKISMILQNSTQVLSRPAARRRGRRFPDASALFRKPQLSMTARAYGLSQASKKRSRAEHEGSMGLGIIGLYSAAEHNWVLYDKLNLGFINIELAILRTGLFVESGE